MFCVRERFPQRVKRVNTIIYGNDLDLQPENLFHRNNTQHIYISMIIYACNNRVVVYSHAMYLCTVTHLL